MAASGSFAISISAVDHATKVLDGVNKSLQKMRAPTEKLQKSFSKFMDLSGLTKMGHGFEGMARSANNAAKAVSRIVAPLGAITSAASLAGVYKLVSDFAEAANKLTISAERIGMPTDKLAKWNNMAKLAGSSAEAMTNSLLNVAKIREDALFGRGDPNTLGSFRSHGVDIGTRDNPNSPGNILKQELEALKNFKGPQQGKMNLMARWGIDPSLIRMIDDTGISLDQLQKDVDKYGFSSKEATIAGLKMKYAQDELTMSVGGLGDMIAAKLSPILTPLLTHMADWIAANRDWIATKISDYVRDFVDWCQKLWPQIKDAAKTVNDIAESFGGWNRILAAIVAIELASWASRMVSGLSPLKLAVLAIVAGMERIEHFNNPANLPVDSPFWNQIPDKEQGNYVNSPKSQAFLHPNGGNPNEFHWWNPGSWLGHNANQRAGSAPTQSGRYSQIPIPPAPSLSGDAVNRATELLRGYEGFSSKAGWDVNAYRAGYGSDTTTDPTTGAVSPITAGSTVTRAAAEADLQRRIRTQFMPSAAKAIGADAWAKLTPDEQAALTSVAYNYGHLPTAVANAAKSGNAADISKAISGLASANGGINAKRRASEAQIALGGAAQGPSAAPVSKINGAADVRISLTGLSPENFTSTASTTGDLFCAPRISHAMS